jgi:hypothetical protein
MQSSSDTYGVASPSSMIDYQITPKTVYGKGRIVQDGKEVTRELWMDVYEPQVKSSQPRPAIVLTFGGSLHRGGPRHTFLEGGVQDTSMGDYGRKLATRGYVCFAIDYRLTPEQPKPDRMEYTDDVIGSNRSLEPAMEQINKVRKIMDLEPLREDNYLLKTLTESPKNPPLLMFQGQYDLDGVILLTPVLMKHCQRVNLEHELVWVPGFGHFYPAGASTLAFDGSRTSVEERIVDFLGKVIPISG